MPEIFNYEFMRKAFLIGILLAIVVPCIGVTVVLKRLSMMGDALSHMSLAGVALGLIFGFNPILGAIIACVFAAFGISAIKNLIPKYSEMSIAIMMSLGVGLAGVLSGFVPNSANFNSFLFGSIVAISNFELYMIVIISMVVLFCFFILYNDLFYITFDEQGARLSGVNVDFVNYVFTFLTAVTISMAARAVGALIVSSMLVIPVACALQIAKSYNKTVIYSILFDLFFTLSGLTLSYYMGLKPGSTIVLIGIITLIFLFLIKRKLKK